MGQPGGGGGTGNSHDYGAASAVLGHRGDGEGLGRFGYRHRALRPCHQGGQAGVPVGQAQEGGQEPRGVPFAGGPPGPALLKPSGARHSDRPVALTIKGPPSDLAGIELVLRRRHAPFEDHYDGVGGDLDGHLELAPL